MGTLSLSLYKAVMYLECSPFLEKERDSGGPIHIVCKFSVPAFLIISTTIYDQVRHDIKHIIASKGGPKVKRVEIL